MALSRWKKKSERVVFRNPWWTYKQDETILPSGTTGEYHYVHTYGSSCVIPAFPDGRIVMVNQYRYLADRESLEFPCGGVKEGHTYDQTAVQELAEEAGFQASEWMVAGEFNPYNGVTDEICRVYIARALVRTHARPDDTEEFERLVLTPDEIDARIISGVIWDGMSIAAWSIARPHL